MKTLIVGAGALGGIIGARLLAAGASVSLATRNATSAEEIKASGLRVTGIGGDLSIETGEVAPLADYSVSGSFDLIVLATKAQDAIDVAPSLVRLLAPGGTLLPVHNGGVAQILARQLGDAWDIRAKQCRLPFDRRAWRGRERSKRTGASVA
jgi:2-dehydropantoate 2-reductase